MKQIIKSTRFIAAFITGIAMFFGNTLFAGDAPNKSTPKPEAVPALGADTAAGKSDKGIDQKSELKVIVSQINWIAKSDFTGIPMLLAKSDFTALPAGARARDMNVIAHSATQQPAEMVKNYKGYSLADKAVAEQVFVKNFNVLQEYARTAMEVLKLKQPSEVTFTFIQKNPTLETKTVNTSTDLKPAPVARSGQ